MLAVALSFAMAVPTTFLTNITVASAEETVPAPAEVRYYGDVNNDGFVTAEDALIVLEDAAQLAPMTDDQ